MISVGDVRQASAVAVPTKADGSRERLWLFIACPLGGGFLVDRRCIEGLGVGGGGGMAVDDRRWWMSFE